MKSVNAKVGVLIAVIAAILGFQSCSKSKDPAPGVVSFSTSTATYGEDQGTVSIDLKLSAKQSADVSVNFTFGGTGDTYYYGDYSLATVGPIVITAGQTEASIKVKIIDDTQIDADDVLTLKLTTVTGHAQLSTTSSLLSFVLTITNNDVLPADKLQADLTWDQGQNSNIDAVNMDLFLLSNVVITDNTITGATVAGESAKTSGFETMFVNSTDTDQDYYVAIQYTTGTGLVNYVLTFNGFGFTDSSDAQSFPATAAPTSSGVNSVVYGPFTKSGETFSGRVGVLTPKGKIHSYKATNLIKR